MANFLPAALAENARAKPDAEAFIFIDYEADPDGFAETLTWAETHRRVQAVASELAGCGAPGDRVAIIAPQSLEYVVGFLGTLMAGLVAVPLPVPAFGAHAERVGEALNDSAPIAILTTSAVADDVVGFAAAVSGAAPAVFAVDTLDFFSPQSFEPVDMPSTKTALLQYTSGSTRTPAAVMVSHKNIAANVGQVFADYYGEDGGHPPPDLAVVSWLPFYHDMGLLLGMIAPVIAGNPAVVMDPVAFLQKPARWIRLLADRRAFSAAPNFGFELATARTSDDDIAGCDLERVHSILSGAERIHAATLRRFTERFRRFNLAADAIAPSYGLAEAMVYVGAPARSDRPVVGRFDYEKLTAGHAEACQVGAGVELVSIGAPRSCTVRIVDPASCVEVSAGTVGEVWVHGDNVSTGYWGRPQQTEETFGGRIVTPSPGTPVGPWLRTGDLAMIADGQFYIVGRIKDLLIIDGANHYPDDLEATIQEISQRRVAAVAVPGDGGGEQLAVVIEVKSKGEPQRVFAERLVAMKRQITAAVSKNHAVRIADLVAVGPGSLPITTSGKVSRSACVDMYRNGEFARLDT